MHLNLSYSRMHASENELKSKQHGKKSLAKRV